MKIFIDYTTVMSSDSKEHFVDLSNKPILHYNDDFIMLSFPTKVFPHQKLIAISQVLFVLFNNYHIDLPTQTKSPLYQTIFWDPSGPIYVTWFSTFLTLSLSTSETLQFGILNFSKMVSKSFLSFMLCTISLNSLTLSFLICKPCQAQNVWF